MRVQETSQIKGVWMSSRSFHGGKLVNKEENRRRRRRKKGKKKEGEVRDRTLWEVPTHDLVTPYPGFKPRPSLK